MQQLIPLRQLAAGQKAEIGQLVGCPDHVQRLEEIGLRSGVMIEMVKAGSPCIIQLSGSRLCYRESSRFNILVRT